MNHLPQAKKIIVGLSGGVDSSVTAYLLCQQGYEVEALFMKNWQDEDDGQCTASLDAADAQSVCDKLGIPLHVVNFSDDYWQNVFEHFLAEYQAGRTPNPDILCNREIKFKVFLEHALALGADAIATGHYAQIEKHEDQLCLTKGADANKDQSYFLYALTQYPLHHACFPIGHLTKPEVRQIAAEQGFITSDKKDSTGICFIGERRFTEFLQQYLATQPGPMKTPEGQTVGEHQGLMFYTIGQRKGLHIGGRADAHETPWYVLDKDVTNNILIVGQGQHHPGLYHRRLHCDQLTWVADKPPHFPLTCKAKTRYRQTEQACEVIPFDSNSLSVEFTQAQRAVTPGQSIVFYQDNLCLGGGIISQRFTT